MKTASKEKRVQNSGKIGGSFGGKYWLGCSNSFRISVSSLRVAEVVSFCILLVYRKGLRGAVGLAIKKKKKNLGLPLFKQFSVYLLLNSFSPYKGINKQKRSQWLWSKFLSQIYLVIDRDGLQIWMFVLVYMPYFLFNDGVRCSPGFHFVSSLTYYLSHCSFLLIMGHVVLLLMPKSFYIGCWVLWILPCLGLDIFVFL